MRTNTRPALSAAFAFCLALAATAGKPAVAQQGVAVGAAVEATADVVAIDKADRMLILRGPAGNIVEMEVGEEDPESGERATIPMARRNLVFNVEQIDGLSDEFKSKFLPKADEQHAHSPIEKAETFISHVPADTIEADRIPCYIPSKDLVSMPALNRFKTPEQYYATYFHELAHWTKHKSRLNRLAKAGQEGYALEELTAEITASFVCPLVGIEPLIHEEHAPYLEHYIKLLTDEPQAFLKACSQAEKAADYLKAYQPDL